MLNLFKFIKRNPCKECAYYHPENNTCQSKKVATMGYGYVTLFDRLFCEPYKVSDWQKYYKECRAKMEEGEE